MRSSSGECIGCVACCSTGSNAGGACMPCQSCNVPAGLCSYLVLRSEAIIPGNINPAPCLVVEYIAPARSYSELLSACLSSTVCPTHTSGGALSAAAEAMWDCTHRASQPRISFRASPIPMQLLVSLLGRVSSFEWYDSSSKRPSNARTPLHDVCGTADALQPSSDLLWTGRVPFVRAWSGPSSSVFSGSTARPGLQSCIQTSPASSVLCSACGSIGGIESSALQPTICSSLTL
mmetsp:Transcript_76174/g.123770  ORF Transcript_76174/g.123770 Transcript_76174/m.123770 type:complete len:234 (-) Transcript_76174:17-718(-)